MTDTTHQHASTHTATHERFLALAGRITFPGLVIEVIHESSLLPYYNNDRSQVEVHLGHYLRVSCPEGTCNVTASELPWVGRKWRLSRHMSDGEFMLTALKAVLTALEHEARESFKVDGVALHDSHIPLEAWLAFVKGNGGHTRTEAPLPPCPTHYLTQHRDAQPRWCNVCGYDAKGKLRHIVGGDKRYAAPRTPTP